jgi:DNA-binding transcriptional LysR family regulator
MIDRYLLRYVLAVIDQGNFSRAAAACNVSQPTLSAGIAKLERSLGRALFNRSNRRVELTEAGVRLAVHARRIEAEFTLAEREVLGSAVANTLRLGTLITIPSAWIATFIARLQAIGGDDRAELVEGRERDLLDRLARGRIDVALTILRPDNDRFVREGLFSEGYSLAMAAGHPLSARDMIEPTELADNSMIVRRNCELLSDTSRYFTAHGVRPFFAARTTSDDRAMAYVRAGLGVTVMPDSFRSPGMVRPRLADFGFVREVGLLYAPHVDRHRLREGQVLRTLCETIEAQRGQA